MNRTVLWIILVCTLSASIFITGASGATDKPLTNADIVKMIKAELGEEIILRAIENGPSEFDTSPDALISLKNDGATKKILDAILTTKAPKTNQAPPTVQTDIQKSIAAAMAKAGIAGIAGNAAYTGASLNDVFLVDGDTRTLMKRIGGGIRADMSFFGGATAWTVFSGSHAVLKIRSSTPVFDVVLPTDARQSDLVKIINAEVKSNLRQILTQAYGLGGALAARSRDKQVIPVVLEELKEEVMVGGRLAKVRVKPASPLPPGEYFLIKDGLYYYDFSVEAAN